MENGLRLDDYVARATGERNSTIWVLDGRQISIEILMTPLELQASVPVSEILTTFLLDP